MIKFKKLTLDNVGPHSSTFIEFRDGINIIRGDNFSGKSIIFQALTKLVCNELPYSATKRAREIFGTITCSFADEKNNYEVQYVGRNNKFKISENGYLLEYRQTKDAALKVGEILPWTLNAWQNFCYLSNDSFPLLMRGTPLMRRSVFEHLLPNETDDMFKVYKRRLAELNERAIEHKTLVEVFSDNDLAVDEAEIEKYQSRLKWLKVSLTALRKKRDARLKRNNYLKRIDATREQFPEYDSWTLDYVDRQGKSLAAQIEDIKRKIAANIDREVAWLEWERFNKSWTEFEQEHSAWKARHEKLSEQADKYRANLNKLPGFVRTAIETDLASARKLADLKIIKKPPALRDMDSEHDILSEALQLLDHSAEDGHPKNCPVCRQTIQFKKLHGGITARLRKIDDERDLLSEQNDAWRKFNATRTRLEAACGLTVMQAKQHVEDLNKDWQTDIQEKFDEHVRREPREPETVAKPKVRPNNSLADKKEQLVAEQEALRVRWADLNSPAVDLDKLADLEDQTLELERKIADLESRKAQGEDNKRRRSELRRQLKDRPLVEQLTREYSPTGVRNDLLSNIVDRFISDMNYYSPLVFPKNYKFDGRVKDKGIELTCDRGLGFSDIRRLSGAEGKLFTLISLLALKPLLPAEYLSNILVLDEMEASMKGKTRDKFIEVMPLIQEHYPSIWIVSPLNANEFQIEIDDCPVHEYRAVRKNNKSSLLEIR